MYDTTRLDASSGNMICQREADHQIVGSLVKFTGGQAFKGSGDLRLGQPQDFV